MDPTLEAAALITSKITQGLEGAGLRVLYLAERVCYQLLGTDTLRVPMAPLQFRLVRFPWLMPSTNFGGAVFPMPTDLWMIWTMLSSAKLISYHPSFQRYIFFPLLLPFLFYCISTHGDTQIWCSCQAGPATGSPVDPLSSTLVGLYLWPWQLFSGAPYKV